MSTTDPLAPSRIELCQSRADLSAPFHGGTYVVVDVFYFSTTVVELLAAGADCVHVPLSGSDPAAFKRVNPEALVGGEGDGHEPDAHHDFFNSPSDAHRLSLDGRPVSMTSHNGGATVADLRAADADVYVASTTNAAAVGRRLRSVEGPVTLVCAGRDGDETPEDTLGALLVSRYATGCPVEADLRAAYAERLREIRSPLDELPEHRRRDVTEFVAAIDSRAVVPRLDADRLRDDAETTDPVAARTPVRS
ncbi:2-phosphosulfolactate phosphatase [Halapricum sp. CBA1109]|uniref:2-phosphosulfolactate phosphatase n=1 Tax=Halapricum sp. CBA1109 TaxID=2668068 RepID=UPI0012F979B2|nr:2-phosphosulfolactate phosphatase [Halapricum sp. CBA1109]MUV89448.1 2-phosphosulfolactate phosphatase [Halapricum sp. CBA1109]